MIASGFFPTSTSCKLHCLQVKDQDLRGFPVTDESPAKLRGNGNSMHSHGRYAAEDFA